MEASQKQPPENTPKIQGEIIQSYWERQMMIRAEARERITKNPMDSEAKLTWINADGQARRLLDDYVELVYGKATEAI